jgi:hypothetical protein
VTRAELAAVKAELAALFKAEVNAAKTEILAKMEELMKI